MNRLTNLKISVVVVTKNRPENLRNLLHSLVRQSSIPDEVVVVDNNSIKNYESVFQEFQDHLPLKTVVEPTPGIPAARNRGIYESCGDIIIFTDDDCVADTRWIEEIVKPFYKNPYIGIVGGEIFSEKKAGSLVEEFCISETLMRMGRQEKKE
jgi:glycosyltransferase involved in cell wall biosynthesis